jgi:short-subunit dehydrogenase
VILNAGLGHLSLIESLELAEFHRRLDVNVVGACLTVHGLVPTLKTCEAGHLECISCIADKVGMPPGEGYNASKFARTAMTACLFQELRGDGFKVAMVFPGSTATHFLMR